MSNRLSRPGQPAAGLVVHERDLRVPVQVPGEVAQRVVDGCEDVAVDLDAGDVLASRTRAPTARRGRRRRRPRRPRPCRAGVVRQVGDVVAEERAVVGPSPIAAVPAVLSMSMFICRTPCGGIVGLRPLPDGSGVGVRVAVDRHPGEGVPHLVAVQRVRPAPSPTRRAAADLRRCARTALHDAEQPGAPSRRPRPASCRAGCPASTANTTAAEAGDGRDERSPGWAVEPAERHHDRDAAEAGADEVGGVEAVDPAGNRVSARQTTTPAEDERHRRSATHVSTTDHACGHRRVR